ncbi:hypothetical protein [Acinetobacter qingfengensis]|uniref:Uncharacterized protein n=1 Tax=Acinetobacter qingfengensis TaxID=1262585 RepID=A0A1E7QYX5_9GAMM|nr:hypothetical protein [Acinetobacter qingfengensis]OEY92264.1 hypothetical protein BJI46_05825 [Acinetobacter qingfengensis]
MSHFIKDKHQAIEYIYTRLKASNSQEPHVRVFNFGYVECLFDLGIINNQERDRLNKLIVGELD